MSTKTTTSKPLIETAHDLLTCYTDLATVAADYGEALVRANVQYLAGSIRAVDKCVAGVASDFAPPKAAPTDLYIEADLLSTPSHLRVDRFIPRTDTPGNVGVCLSGGGSRSMIASQGQLRGLKALGLLGKVKALSTVSGGSWAAVPFMYLPDAIPDDAFLNGFVADPSELVLAGGRKTNMATVLDYLAPGNLLNVAANPNMSIAGLALQASDLLFLRRLPPDRLWARLIGDNVLAPFGLSKFDSDNLPLTYFTYDAATERAIQRMNPGLNRPAHKYRQPQSANDVVRPFHLCNTSMFITPNPGNSVAPDGMQLVAPVQSTAFFTGILPTGLGVDAGGLQVGGGGVASLAFGSEVVTSSGGKSVATRSQALFALSDITGMSSAFYASLLAETLPELGVLDPAYPYWPVASPAPGEGTKNQFADGGDLEDNGVASLLAYEDIDRLIVFVNSTPLGQDRFGNIKIDMWLPTLFGYTPYRTGLNESDSGYVTYKDGAGNPTPGIKNSDLYFQHNQVFPSDQFLPLLQAVWEQSGSGTNENPATFYQRALDVLPNAWFSVTGGRRVDVLWVILNPVESWTRQLRPEVQGALSRSFPNFNILQIHQSSIEANLMAHLTAWTIYKQADILAEMFRN
jgi:hypothetical protein